MEKRTGASGRGNAGPSWVGDLWGGLASMLVAVPSSIAFGIATYTAFGNEHAGEGALAGILGAAALGLVAPFIGRTPGLISAPCAPAAAVLFATIADLAGRPYGSARNPSDVLALLALTALLAAVLQTLYGILGVGRLIKFIPYPVVSGYLSGVAVLIALGQMPKLFGFPRGTRLFQGLSSPESWKWEGLVVGIVTIVLMEVAPRLTKKVPGAIVGLLGGICCYFALAMARPGLLVLQGNALLIGPIQVSGSFLDAVVGRATALSTISLSSLQLVLVPALTLSVLLSIDTLKTCVGLNALTRQRSNSNRELIGQGVGNLASFLAGGMPGAGTMGPSVVNVASGGNTWHAGVIEGVGVVLALVLLGPQIAWVPLGALAGILLVVAWRMFDKGMFHLLRDPHRRLDFAVIAAVVIVAVGVDLIAAAGVGVALAILLFLRDQIKGSVIRRKLYLNQFSSKTKRLPSEREVLDRHGALGVFCQLQGNLFFGTTDQLFSNLEPDLRAARYLLLDMRRVQSMDYTAAHLFEQMNAQLSERGGQLLFSGMPSALFTQWDFERHRGVLGLTRGEGGTMVSETLDGALEWIEERILEGAGVHRRDDEEPLRIEEFNLFHGFDRAALDTLAACMGERSLARGEKVFTKGDESDQIYLVRRGSVRILLPLAGGQYHHLATIGRGDFFGELSFLDHRSRSAEVEAKVPTDLFALSRTRFNELSRSHVALGVQVFARIAAAIAERLRQADSELRALEER